MYIKEGGNFEGELCLDLNGKISRPNVSMIHLLTHIAFNVVNDSSLRSLLQYDEPRLIVKKYGRYLLNYQMSIDEYVDRIVENSFFKDISAEEMNWERLGDQWEYWFILMNNESSSGTTVNIREDSESPISPVIVPSSISSSFNFIDCKDTMNQLEIHQAQKCSTDVHREKICNTNYQKGRQQHQAS